MHHWDHTGVLKDVQPEDIEDISERFLWLWQESRESDSVKKIHLRGKEGADTLFVITLIEHQSRVDHDMSFRVLRYIVQVLTYYEKEMEEAQEGITKRKNSRARQRVANTLDMVSTTK